jgi:hypothetical protein
VILVFIGAMAFMVSVAMRQTNDLQDEHYYEKELKHQTLIDAENRFKEMGEPISIEDSGTYILFRFPKAAVNAFQGGDMDLLRASDKKKDRKIELAFDEQAAQKISKSTLSKGIYQIRINWNNNNQNYYYQQAYFVN